jgi:hypothetical protein
VLCDAEACDHGVEVIDPLAYRRAELAEQGEGSTGVFDPGAVPA